ncbi:MAG: FAD-dependent oxidoreductase [Gammaproteobacteria bacterium]|nr:FAD-dependent oxidoreductase [Gammaproteobacteria bacterium]
MTTITTDFLVIGGGVMGLCLALEAKRRHSHAKVILIEKEKSCGLHASGRNSGVLHAGFYYSADSLKARFTRDGNCRLTRYCQERGLRINNCGKLVVSKDENDLAGLEELLWRGKRNGVLLHEISAKEAQAIEPRAKTYSKAIFSPTTSSVDPNEVMASLVEDARVAGIEFLTETAFCGRGVNTVLTTRGRIMAGYVINAAGLYADKIAQAFGFSRDYRILPFKGLYLYSDEPPGTLKTHIYPIPDLRNPFLGVHFTLGVDNKVKIGPTAIPAFWREHYHGFTGFSFSECTEILARESAMFFRNDCGFRRLAVSELTKYAKSKMITLASDLAHNVIKKDYRKWGRPGIRAQLVNIKKRKLESDFRYEGDRLSFHVLNAVSPAFTCALPFAEYLFDEIERINSV